MASKFLIYSEYLRIINWTIYQVYDDKLKFMILRYSEYRPTRPTRSLLSSSTESPTTPRQTDSVGALDICMLLITSWTRPASSGFCSGRSYSKYYCTYVFTFILHRWQLTCSSVFGKLSLTFLGFSLEASSPPYTRYEWEGSRLPERFASHFVPIFRVGLSMPLSEFTP